MANRYWVGGTGTWSSTNTANWSTTSGGAGGASVPTAADSVFFDANSNTGTTSFTVTMANSPRVCLDFTASGLDGAMTLAGSSIGLTVSGSLSWPATNFTPTYTGATTFASTTTGKTVTSNGITFPSAVIFNGVGGGWTVSGAISVTGNLTVTAGTVSLASINVTCTGIFYLSGTSTRSINITNSTVTCNSFDNTTSTNETLTATGSVLNVGSSGYVYLGGKTLNTLVFTTANSSNGYYIDANGGSFAGNVTIPNRTAVGCYFFLLNSNVTISGTLNLGTSTSAACRLAFGSYLLGAGKTATVAALSAGASDVDFYGITISGAAAPISGTRFGDAGGTSGITFPAAKTVYWANAGSGNWGASGNGNWSATSGGAADPTMFPLPQDTAVIPSTIPASGSTITAQAFYYLSSFDASARTSNTLTLASSLGLFPFAGNFTGASGLTVTSTLDFRNQGSGVTRTLTSNGSTTNVTTQFNQVGTLQLGGNYTTSTSALVYFGTLSLQSYTLSTNYFNSSNSNVRALSFGTGKIQVTGTGSCFDLTSPTNLTVTGSRQVDFTYAGATAMTVNTYNMTEATALDMNFTAGTYSLTTTNNCIVRNLNFQGYAGTMTYNTRIIYGNLTLGTTTVAPQGVFSFQGSTNAQITGNGKIFNGVLEFYKTPPASVQLQDSFTQGAGYTTYFVLGGLDVQSYILTVGYQFYSNYSSPRTLTGTTGKVYISYPYSGTYTGLINFATSTNLTVTGNPVVELNMGAGSVHYPYLANSQGTPSVPQTNALSYKFSGTANTLILNYYNNQNNYIKNLDLSTYSGTVYFNGNTYITGDVTLGASNTWNYNGYSIYIKPPASSTSNITTNGKVMAGPLYISSAGSGSVVRLQDNFVGTASTAGTFNIYLDGGSTLDLNGKTLTTFNGASIQALSGAGAQNLTFNGGTISLVQGSGFFNNNGTSFTTTAGTGTGYIQTTTSGYSYTINPGGATFNCTLKIGAASSYLSIGNAGTFDNIVNTAQPATVFFPSSATTTFLSGFSLSGTAGNLITVTSTSAPTQHTLSLASGTVNASYLSIANSAATGGATWNALTTNGNVDAGNNSGWYFGTAGASTANMFLMFS